jgi:hypothetical protein
MRDIVLSINAPDTPEVDIEIELDHELNAIKLKGKRLFTQMQG